MQSFPDSRGEETQPEIMAGGRQHNQDDQRKNAKQFERKSEQLCEADIAVEQRDIGVSR